MTQAIDRSLSVLGITKAFPGVVANQDVSLDVYAGQVHAIVGENGAGKSTLMKILYGFYRPDQGRILVRDTEVHIDSPATARRLGIGMVFQQFMLAPALSVLENVALAVADLPFVLPRPRLEEQIRTLSARYGFQIDPRTTVGYLSIGEQQKVEILKLLLARSSILIFDEPTSVLAPHESDALMEVFRRLRADGLAVLFITHKLRQVLDVADHITVLRRGRVTASTPNTPDLTESQLVQLMLGSETDASSMAAPRSAAHAVPDGTRPAIVEIRDANVPDPAGRMPLKDISLTIYAGEIVGVAAVAGNGQRELGDLVLGLRQPTSGSLTVQGQSARHWSPAQLMELGFAAVPEDPLGMGAVPSMSGLENMILPQRKRYARWGGLDMGWAKARFDALGALDRAGLGAPSLDKPIGQLSGGNVQRLVFARELARQPRLLVCFYPTRGLDVPSALAARRALQTHRDSGGSVLLVSEDLDELFELADRLIVLHQGQIVATLRPTETTQHDVGLLMTGAGSELEVVHG